MKWGWETFLQIFSLKNVLHCRFVLNLLPTHYIFLLTGCDRVEYWSSEHYSGHGGERKWGHDKRSKHSVSLFWHVEEHVCLAHRGHGSLQHQLPSLRRTQVLVQTQHMCNVKRFKDIISSSWIKNELLRRYAVPPEHGKRLERLAKGIVVSRRPSYSSFIWSHFWSSITQDFFLEALRVAKPSYGTKWL